jgi:predicted secreted Zn-dependent protease
MRTNFFQSFPTEPFRTVNFRPFARFLLLALLGTGLTAAAQTVQWTTNFYNVTGADFREIRRSIERARPWPEPFDGDTRWTVTWRFTFKDSPAGCTLAGLQTATTITTTMPRWTPPPDVLPEVKERWTRYYTNLLAHEAGHGRFALAAAAEIRQRTQTLSPAGDCDALKRQINQAAGQIIEAYRTREKEYDRRTDHGRNTGGGPPRGPGPGR